MTVANDDTRLKPGMFVEATVVMQTVDDAVIIPEQAITVRAERPGIFLVGPEGRSVRWQYVSKGIREGNRVQVQGTNIVGRVVTLGQHMLDDGSAITIPSERTSDTPKEQADVP